VILKHFTARHELPDGSSYEIPYSNKAGPTGDVFGLGDLRLSGGLAGRALERKDAARHARFLLPRPRLRLPGEWSLAPTTVTDGDIVAYGAGLKVTGW